MRRLAAVMVMLAGCGDAIDDAVQSARTVPEPIGELCEYGDGVQCVRNARVGCTPSDDGLYRWRVLENCASWRCDEASALCVPQGSGSACESDEECGEGEACRGYASHYGDSSWHADAQAVCEATCCWSAADAPAPWWE